MVRDALPSCTRKPITHWCNVVAQKTWTSLIISIIPHRRQVVLAYSITSVLHLRPGTEFHPLKKQIKWQQKYVSSCVITPSLVVKHSFIAHSKNSLNSFWVPLYVETEEISGSITRTWQEQVRFLNQPSRQWIIGRAWNRHFHIHLCDLVTSGLKSCSPIGTEKRLQVECFRVMRRSVCTECRVLKKNSWDKVKKGRFKYLKVVHPVHFLDQCIQFIAPTKCTLLVTYDC
jgi:hypothetical protein